MAGSGIYFSSLFYFLFLFFQFLFFQYFFTDCICNIVYEDATTETPGESGTNVQVPVFSSSTEELDRHLDRFMRSASLAKVTPPFPQSTLREILVQLVAASKCKKGSLRYWLSAGPGDFLLSSAGCPMSAFYAVAIDDDYSQCKDGVKVITSTIPMKSPLFATSKNVNYLPNVLSKMEAEEKGAFASIWIDDKGYIAEGPNVNVAFINKDKELLLPSFDKILSGCTAKRLLELAPKLVERGLLKSVRLTDITVEEGKNAAEMMYVGSSLPILPIITWAKNPLEMVIANWKVGDLTMALSDLLWDDMVAGPGLQRICVPYAER
ncbi:hypothetical protein MKX01_027247 [Papaver californicum]|nr:hypothetical protein MKX01_027247 [Papaver californicum]